MRPMLPDCFQSFPGCAASPVMVNHSSGFQSITSCTQPENYFIFLPCSKFKTYLNGRTGIQAAPILPERRVLLMAAGALKVPLRPRNSIRSPLTERFVSSVSKKATRLETLNYKDCVAISAPLMESDSVMICMADLDRKSPSTHST